MQRLAHAEHLLWISLLLLVPVSASPLLPLGAGTLVRPLSLVPALLILAAAAFRILALRQRVCLPREGGLLLLVFVGYAVLAGLTVMMGQPDDPFKGQTPTDSFLRALATLAIGIIFYAVARLNIRTIQDVRAALRWLFIGMSASVALAVLQVIAIVQAGAVLRAVQAITNIFAVYYDGLESRAQGMTFEPSWLATQIILLMLPPLVARILSRQAAPCEPATRRNVRIALAGVCVAITGLLCAGSRFGLIAAVLMLLLAGLMALRQGRVGVALIFITLLAAGGGGIVALGSFSAGAGASYVLGPLDYITNGPQGVDLGDLSDSSAATAVTGTLTVAGRTAAGEAAFNLWRDHPLFGVSLGNNYRYFGRYAPDWAFDSGLFTLNAEEGTAWLDNSAPEKANAKNLFLRLLSETGLIGLVLLALFFLRQLFSARAGDSYYAYFRLTLAAALLFSGFNQDTFADPAMWIMLVICAAMGRAQDVTQ